MPKLEGAGTECILRVKFWCYGATVSITALDQMELDEEPHQRSAEVTRNFDPDVRPLRGFNGLHCSKPKPGHRKGEVPLGRN
jgi:hypothetical protein